METTIPDLASSDLLILFEMCKNLSVLLTENTTCEGTGGTGSNAVSQSRHSNRSNTYQPQTF